MRKTANQGGWREPGAERANLRCAHSKTQQHHKKGGTGPLPGAVKEMGTAMLTIWEVTGFNAFNLLSSTVPSPTNTRVSRCIQRASPGSQRPKQGLKAGFWKEKRAQSSPSWWLGADFFNTYLQYSSLQNPQMIQTSNLIYAAVICLNPTPAWISRTLKPVTVFEEKNGILRRWC